MGNREKIMELTREAMRIWDETHAIPVNHETVDAGLVSENTLDARLDFINDYILKRL